MKAFIFRDWGSEGTGGHGEKKRGKKTEGEGQGDGLGGGVYNHASVGIGALTTTPL